MIPFSELRSPKKEFRWRKEQRAPLNLLKTFRDNTILIVPDLYNSLVVHVDGSSRGMG